MSNVEYIVCYAKNKKLLEFGNVELSDKAKIKNIGTMHDIGPFRRNILFHKTRGRNYFDVKSYSIMESDSQRSLD